MFDWNGILSLGADVAPAAAFIALASAILWIVWGLVRRLRQLTMRRPTESRSPITSPQIRQEPVLVPAAKEEKTASSDAAELVALRASIDALTQQVAALVNVMPSARMARPAPHQGTRVVKNDNAVAPSAPPPVIVPRRVETAS